MKENSFNFDNTYIRLPKIFYSKQSLNIVPSPKLVILNYQLIEELGLNKNELEQWEYLQILAGNITVEGAINIAEAYAGHQFGHFTMLGDGRAMLIGEHITPKGVRVDIQLKGSGRTLYSRGGDGKATLGPMLREYIISEAMKSLGIPTSRSLAVVTTGEMIIREEILLGAILTRTSASHIRVGTFQYASKYGSVDDLKALADYTIDRHFNYKTSEENKYLFLLKEVIKRQAELIAKWQSVGFIHGVMNTDNMTISGETIDYGPCAFMDTYDSKTVFSSIDINGRYSYENQPGIAGWNLARFAETLLPLLHEDEKEAVNIAQKAISNFPKIYKEKYLLIMRRKLGLFNEEVEDNNLIYELLNIMEKYNVDYTNTFRELTLNNKKDLKTKDKEDFGQWIKLWKERLKRQKQSEEEIRNLMKNNNPAVIPRNYRVEEALNAAVKSDDYTIMEKLLKAISKPYDYSENQEEYIKGPNKTNRPYKTFCGT